MFCNYVKAFVVLSILFAAQSADFLFAGDATSTGHIFKEFTYDKDHIRCALRSNHQKDGTLRPNNYPDMMEFHLSIDDLDHAIGAEFFVEYWGGHIGTSDQKFKFNGNEFIPLPTIHNTPSDPQCYYRNILGAGVAVPLDHLKTGDNVMQFSLGPQTCYSFNWAWYFLYAVTMRIYYDDSKPHPVGQITFPAAGDTLTENPRLAARASSPNGNITEVVFLGYYDDFDWKGTGEFRQWHFQYQYGTLKKYLGRVIRPPFEATWNSMFVPDQSDPMKIKAIITDETGMKYMTPEVENIHFNRDERSVKMFTSDDVPENFAVRVGRRKSCTITLPDNLEQAKSARLVLSTWSGATDDGARHEIGVNDVKLSDNFGIFHSYSYKMLHVPLELLKPGSNEIYIYSDYHGHALEINWPGPALLIEYEN